MCCWLNILIKVYVESKSSSSKVLGTIDLSLHGYHIELCYKCCTGLPALYLVLTVPLGYLVNGTWHYGSDSV